MKKSVVLFQPGSGTITFEEVSSTHIDDLGMLTIHLRDSEAHMYGNEVVTNMPFIIYEKS